MTSTFTFAILIVVVALSFDFLNGFHDAANSIATVVSTRVLSPRVAVIWAAFFNFVAAFTFGTAVARTMGNGMIRLEAVNLYVILAGLLGAIFWDILTWYYGLPVSSSHALIGGYAGAAIAKAGWGVILLEGWTKTLLFIILSPAIGFVLGGSLMLAVYWIFRSLGASASGQVFPQAATPLGRRLQLWPRNQRCAEDHGHYRRDSLHRRNPEEVLHSLLGRADGARGHCAGNLAGGWRIVKTMGMKITRLKPVGGFCAETAAADQPAGHCHGRNPRLHHPHHRRRHHGCGQRPALQRRPLGSGTKHHVGLDPDHPHLRRRLLSVLPGDPPFLFRRVRAGHRLAQLPQIGR